MEKVCTKCLKILPTTNEFFGNNKKHNDGLKYACKVCTDIYRKSRTNTNEGRSKGSISSAKWIKDNPERFKQIKKRSYNKHIKKYRDKYMNDPNPAIRRKELAPIYVAGVMNMSIKDLTPEVYETKKLVIQIKRELWKKKET